jgi:hypothetical protein
MSLPPPMSTSRQLRRGATLLLLALALATGLLLSTTRQSGARLAEVDELILPSVRLVHEMTVVVDEARGLSALHLLHADRAEQRDLEGRLQAARQRIERRMAVSRQRLADDTERRHFQRVRTSLSAYWAAQERLLVASRQAADTPPAANRSRALLGGESQAAFQQLRADLDAWWAYTDELAGVALAQAASQARQQALLLGLQALLLLGLGACLLAGRPTRGAGARTAGAPWPPTGPATGPTTALAALSPAAPPPVSRRPADGPALSLDQLALQARLLALNAAVAAARGGAVGPSARGAVGSSARRAEQDLSRLAVQLGATATRLSSLATSAPTHAEPGDPADPAERR